MDTSRPAVTEIATRASSTRSTAKRQQRTVEEKRRIVEETLIEGASVARVARAHGVNANQVFGWRRLYLAGQLGGSGAIKLLPVQVKEGSPALATLPRVEDFGSTSLSGTIHIELRHAQVRIEGSADPVLVRVLLECLRA
jgi:transposase